MAELLAYLARELVDDPAAVRVETEERDGALVLVLHVARRRHREGDRPSGQDRACAADDRARERRPRGTARARRDRRSRRMKVAALYDIHGMPWALEAVLAEVDADALVFGGDYLYGPYPRETSRSSRSLDAYVLRGNCEDLAEDWERSQLADGDLEWLQSLPLAATVDGVLYCHATPTSNLPITTAVTPAGGRRRHVRGCDGNRRDRPHASPVRSARSATCASSTRARSACPTRARSPRSGRSSRTASRRSGGRRSTSSGPSPRSRASAWPHARGASSTRTCSSRSTRDEAIARLESRRA